MRLKYEPSSEPLHISASSCSYIENTPSAARWSSRFLPSPGQRESSLLTTCWSESRHGTWNSLFQVALHLPPTQDLNKAVGTEGAKYVSWGGVTAITGACTLSPLP